MVNGNLTLLRYQVGDVEIKTSEIENDLSVTSTNITKLQKQAVLSDARCVRINLNCQIYSSSHDLNIFYLIILIFRISNMDIKTKLSHGKIESLMNDIKTLTLTDSELSLGELFYIFH